MIKRELEKIISFKTKQYPVISITGPRQSGKTTLVKKIFHKYFYANLELPDVRIFAAEDPRSFLNQSLLMIIDEIQYCPKLLSYIQGIVDSDNTKKFIITGSQNLLISDKVSQSLAGRVFILNLLPLSLSELKTKNLIENNLIKQIFNGFYPRIYDKKLNNSLWYNNYIQTYLERDVRNIKNIGDLSLFQKFLGLLAGRTGQIMNLTSLANDTGVSVPTINSWLSILEASFIIYKLRPFYNNWSKRLIKAPKIHFIDTGLVCTLLNINSYKELEKHPLVGHIFESFIFSEYLKKKINQQQLYNFYYWREKNGKEIDLLIDKGSRVQAIEIKFGQTVIPDFIQNLKYYKKISKQTTDLELIYGGTQNQKRDDYVIKGWSSL